MCLCLLSSSKYIIILLILVFCSKVYFFPEVILHSLSLSLCMHMFVQRKPIRITIRHHHYFDCLWEPLGNLPCFSASSFSRQHSFSQNQNDFSMLFSIIIVNNIFCVYVYVSLYHIMYYFIIYILLFFCLHLYLYLIIFQ